MIAVVVGAGGCDALEGTGTALGATTSSSRGGDSRRGTGARPEGPFLKGQLHAHTWGSQDSDAPVETVVRWYSERGFDFLVITDHNRVTRGPETPSMMVLPGVELTINRPTCEPPPPLGRHCLLHMNALLPERAPAPHPWFERGESDRRDALFREELSAAKASGAVAMLNHPNFHFAAGADEVTALAAEGLALLEIANEARDSANEGDAAHPSTEAIWDEALTRGAKVFGTATDDAHDYFESEAEERRWPLAYTGDRGFVMVRAERSAGAIREALRRGDFYASNGLYLARVEMGAEQITVEAASERAVWFEVIGAKGFIHRAEAGRIVSFDPRAFGSPYVRVRVTDAEGRRAWTQPVFTRRSP